MGSYLSSLRSQEGTEGGQLSPQGKEDEDRRRQEELLKHNRDPERREDEDFRASSSDRDFKALMLAGQAYLKLQYPRRIQDIEADSTAKTLLERYDERIIQLLANSHVGQGTDPERLENTLLNIKGRVLYRPLFTTLRLVTRANGSYEKVHLLIASSNLTQANKIDFGISGGYADVSLGFSIASETEKYEKGQSITGIIDNRYTWAKTDSHLKHERIHKYLAVDFEKAVERIGLSLKEIKKLQSENKDAQHVLHDKLPQQLDHLFDKYGTHVILECSFGYRMETRTEKTLEENGTLSKFKRGLELAALSFAKIGSSYESTTLKDTELSESLQGIRMIGSKYNVARAMTGKIQPEEWCQLCAYGGDADVVSHDKTVLLADVIGGRDGYEDEARLLRYLTLVRVRDLQVGWNKSIFAFSYKLVFKPYSGGGWWKKLSPDSGVYVQKKG